jgi:hypothetical protein
VLHTFVIIDRAQICPGIDIHAGTIIERIRDKHPQRVKGKFWLVATTFQLWNRSQRCVPIHSWVDDAKEPERPVVREMRLRDARSRRSRASCITSTSAPNAGVRRASSPLLMTTAASGSLPEASKPGGLPHHRPDRSRWGLVTE